VEQRIVIKFLVGENVPSAEIHHRLQQQYGEECLLRKLKMNAALIEPPLFIEWSKKIIIFYYIENGISKLLQSFGPYTPIYAASNFRQM